MWNFRTSEKGFTLIELLIVVAIIGILAAIAVPQYLRARDDARNKAVLENAMGTIGVLTTEMQFYLRSTDANNTYALAATGAVGAFVNADAGLTEAGSLASIRGARPANTDRTPDGVNPAFVIGAAGALYQTELVADETAPIVAIFPNLNDGAGGIQVAVVGWPKNARVD